MKYEKLTKFQRTLMEVENDVRAGWDKNLKLWFPHKSLEGGSKTIAYGHKIKFGEDFSGGITEKEAIKLFKKDFYDHKEKAMFQFGIEEWLMMPEKYQNVIINIVFNVGSFKRKNWPKLIKALQECDEPAIRREMVTSYKSPSGARIPLFGRATRIANSLNLKKGDK